MSENVITHYLSQSGCVTIKVNFNEKEFNRNTSNAILEAHIEKGWAEKLAKNPKLWNGSKFRLAGTEIDGNTGETVLQLGLTGYRDLHFTNYNPPLENSSEPLKYEYLGNPLGVASLLITNDQKAIFLKRASWLGENPNMFDVPGGHAEPDNVKDKILSNENISQEIFNSQLMEIVEETNTDINLIKSHKLHGIFGLPPSKRPVSYFITKVEKSAEDIIKAFNKSEEDSLAKEESSYLFYKDLHELEKFWRSEKKLCGNGVFAAGVYLYSVGRVSKQDFLKVAGESFSFSEK